MNRHWLITIWVAPHSTGNGHGNDQKLVGDTFQKFDVDADGIDVAMDLAKAIVMGIKSNPMVWIAEVVGVVGS